jgi:hypothetical protein
MPSREFGRYQDCDGTEETAMAKTDTETELQRSSQEFLRALMALQVMELEKQALDNDDPKRVGLAIDIEELTLGLLGRSQYQTRLAADLQGAVLAEPRHTPKVLSDWREAERRLREASRSVRRIALEATDLREEYQRSITRARSHANGTEPDSPRDMPVHDQDEAAIMDADSPQARGLSGAL